MSDDLLNELLERPIGKIQPEAESPKEFHSIVSVSGGTASVEIQDEDDKTNADTALRYLADEGQDPAEWEVTHFRKIEYGNGLSSVKFSYKRVAASLEVPESFIDPALWRAALISDTPSLFAIPLPELGGVYSIKIADPQFGKKRTEEAIENYKRGIRGHVAAIRALPAGSVKGVHLAWMGDETENVVNSYGNQPHTIELNRTQQLQLDYDMRVWALREVLALGYPVSASSVISNHGEWTRNGGKEPVTTQGDNASTYIARVVKDLFNELEPFTGQHVEWTIGGGEPGVSINLAGVDCYYSHGYIEKGKGGSTEIRTKSAVERQILGKTEQLASTQLWFMAHYHHFYLNEFEGRTLFGCPALEAEKSSEYMLSQYGVWSPPGMLGVLITDQASRGYSQINVY